MRSRRSCLAVPGSNPRFLEKAQGIDADEVFLDLEDSVAPLAKEGARKNIVAALREGDWSGKTRVVRVNDLGTQWTYRDVIEVVEGAGEFLDCLMLPKVEDPTQVVWLDTLLTQIEKANGLEVGRIGIEAQIESAGGLVNVDAIGGLAAPGDAGLRPRRLHGLDQHADPGGRRAAAGLHRGRRLPLHPDAHPDGRAHARPAGHRRPVPAIKDLDGYRRVAGRAAALGFDGKWVLHPSQVEAANEVFSPSQEDYDHAELILDAYDYYTTVERRGAVMLGDEMIDEASRKMALVVAAKGRAAGLGRTGTFTPPTT